MSDVNSLVATVLIEGLGDLVDDNYVVSLASEVAPLSDVDSRTMALGAIAELLVRGWARAGSMDDDGFALWEESTALAYERIARTWLSEWNDEWPTPGAITWLALTDSGRSEARSILDRRQEAASLSDPRGPR